MIASPLRCTSVMETAEIDLVAPPPVCGPIEVSDPATVREICRLRARVWRAEGFSAIRPCPDEHTHHARHWIAVRQGELVAAARLCFHNSIEETPEFEDIRHLGLSVPHRFAFMSHLIVSKTARGHRLGTCFDAVRVEAARRAGVKSILGRFYDYRVKGLLALGFRSIAQFHYADFENRLVHVMQLDF
jgi:hypothetical protein